MDLCEKKTRKRGFGKRILGIIISAMMILTMIPATAFAADSATTYTKVDMPEAGKQYVIVATDTDNGENSYFGMTAEKHTGYTNNQSQAAYAGFKGVSLSIENGKISNVDAITPDMIWKAEALDAGYSFVDNNGKYLKGDTSSTPIQIREANSADTWIYSDGKLKSTNASSSKSYYLTFDRNHDVAGGFSSTNPGTADLFTIRSNGDQIAFYEVSTTGGSGEPSVTPAEPGDLEKVDTPESGKDYVVVIKDGENYALNTVMEAEGYTASTGTHYYGIKGTTVTVADDVVTSDVTKDMVWTVTATDATHISLKNKATGKYLAAQFEQVAGVYEDGVFTQDESVNWTYSSGTLKPSGMTRYLVYNTKSDNGNDQAFFTVRSGGEQVVFYNVGDATVKDPVVVTPPTEPETIAVTGIALNKTTLELEKGYGTILEATVTPDNATDKTVTWSSSDATVVEVTMGGALTAKKAGTATITAKAGEKTATCVVTVTETPEEPETPSAPEDLSKVDSASLASGKYVVVINDEGNHALNVNVTDGYHNSYNYHYAGFKGKDVTVAGNKITSAVTKDMVWDITVSGTAVSLKNDATGEYLDASYGGNPTEGKIFTSATSTNWTLTDGKLQMPGSTRLLTYEKTADVTGGVSSGEANLFTVRSSGETVDFYYVGNATEIIVPTEPETPEEPAEPGDLEKVSTPASGKDYVVVIKDGDHYALNNAMDDEGYTASTGVHYYGIKGTKVTVASDVVTSDVTEDMVWTVTATDSTHISLKNKATGKYLAAQFEQVGDVYEDGVFTQDASVNWTYSASAETLKMSGNDRYLVYNTTADSANDHAFFTVRSGGEKVAFYNVGNATVKPAAPVTIAVTGVTLNKATTTLEIGATESLTATVAPANATDKTYTWASSNQNVATVVNGVVTAKAAGTATITVTTTDGSKTAQCVVTVEAPVPTTTTYVAFTSDVHNTADNTAANRVDTLVNSLSSSLGGVTFDTMGFCGDNGSASEMNESTWWGFVNNVMTKVSSNSHIKGDGFFVAGNHEYYNGKYGSTTNATAAKIKKIGTVESTDAYVMYSFGAAQWEDGYNLSDITALENYLKTAPTNKPIFILSHFPIHSYSSRNTQNSDALVDVLNKYSDKHQIIFLWGHNHTLSDPHYDKVITGELDGTAIGFTYAAASCMSDAEYTGSTGGSASVKGKIMVATIKGTDVELTYYNTSAAKVASGKAAKPGENTVVVPEPDGTDNLTKVTKPVDGEEYVVVIKDNGNHALNIKEDAGYTNSSNYTYSGFKGTSVTIAGNQITSDVTADMVWKAYVSGNTIALKNEVINGYLTSSYGSNSAGGSTGKLFVQSNAATWTLTSSNTLQSDDSSKYLVYEKAGDASTTVSSGSEDVFTVRSSGETVEFYKVGTATVKPSAVTVTPLPDGNEPELPEEQDPPVIPTPSGSAVYVAFSSDMHNGSDNVAANRLNSWITATSKTLGNVTFDDMGFCGDNGSAYEQNEANYWKYVQADMDVVANHSLVTGNGIFVAGNHEFYNGKFDTTTNATAKKIYKPGLAKNAEKYVIYSFGATSQNDSTSGYKQEDIDALATYLETAPTNKPIFILSHFPIHSYNSRSTKNANKLVNVLNTYGETHKIIFLWGHNHTESDTHYDGVITGKIDSTQINFTYAAAGCMSDSEYTGANGGSASVKGKGLVATIDGNNVTLSYFREDGSLLSQGMAVQPGSNPNVDVTPIEPSAKPEAGKKYIIVSEDGYALTTTAGEGYTNGSSSDGAYVYNGLAGVPYTKDMEITGDMVWGIEAGSNGTIYIKSGTQYLNATYKSANNGANANLSMGSKDDTWTFADDLLKSTNASNGNSSDKFLTHGNTSADNASNTFSVRSESNATPVRFVEYTGELEPGQKPVVALTGIALNPTSVSIHANTEYRLVVVFTPADATNQIVKWTSSDTSVATVDAVGNVTGIKVGTATITATSEDGGFTATCALTVTAAETPGTHTHTWNEGTITKDATCTEEGVLTLTCTECAETTTQIIPATGHKVVTDPAVAPTCISGKTEGSHCDVCGEIIKAQETLAPTGAHQFGDWMVTLAPTEEEKGSQFHTCEICGTREAETIPALGHRTHKFPEEGEITKAPTCTEAGEMTLVCIGCDETKVVALPASGHTAAMIPAVEPSCLESGLTAGYYCTVCDEVLVAQTVVPARGHVYNGTICAFCGMSEDDGLQEVPGKGLAYYVDGKPDTTYTGFAALDGNEYYVVNGIVDGTITDVIKDVDGMIGSKGVWYNVVNSKVAHVDTVAKNSNGWWKITDGVVEFGYNGFASNDKGDWYIENGKVTFAKDDVIKDANGALGKPGAWYYVKGSKVTYANTVAKNANGWWCIHNGVVDFTCNSVEKNDKGWWKITNGKVDFNYTGVAKNSLGWWRIESGKVNFNYNGIAYNSNGGWLLQKGKVIFSYTGKYTWKGKTYNIVKGKVS